MAFTLYSLLQAALLCVNAIAVLHEERFLKNSEWDVGPGGGGGGTARGRGPETAARGTAWGGTGQEAAKGLRLGPFLAGVGGKPSHLHLPSGVKMVPLTPAACRALGVALGTLR